MRLVKVDWKTKNETHLTLNLFGRVITILLRTKKLQERIDNSYDLMSARPIDLDAVAADLNAYTDDIPELAKLRGLYMRKKLIGK